MIHYSSPMIGFELCTIDACYGFAETLSAPAESLCRPFWGNARERSVDEHGRTVSVPFPHNGAMPPSEVANITVRVRDIALGLKSMSDQQLAWIEDLGDDPIVLTSDFYEVFLACQKLIEERRRAG